MQSFSTLVIGGGVSGLIYAYERALAGESVLVLESAPHVGGAVASHTVGGIEANTGAEAFAVGRGHVAGLVSELGLDPVTVSPATGVSYIVGDSYAYASPKNAIMGMPSKPLSKEVRDALGLPGALRAYAERFLPASRGIREGVSIAEFVRARYGKAVLERLVAPIIRGVHSADPEKFELAAVMPTLAAAVEKHGSAQKAIEQMLIERGERASSGAAVRSLVPNMAELPKALARSIEEHGGTVLTSAPVTVIRATGNQAWTVTTSTSLEAITREYSAEKLVLATGPEEAKDLLASIAPQIAGLIPEAPATPVRLATLVLDNPELDAKPRGNGVLVAPSATTIRAKAMTHASAKWDHIGKAAAAVKPGRHIVRLSYGRGEAGDLPDPHEFPWLAIDDAAAILGLQPSDLNVADWALTEWNRTMRQSGPGHTAQLATLDAALEEQCRRPTSPLPFLDFTGAWRAGNGLEAITRFTRDIAKKGHSHD